MSADAYLMAMASAIKHVNVEAAAKDADWSVVTHTHTPNTV